MEVIELLDPRFVIGSRPPNDNFSHELFVYLTQKYAPQNMRAYQVWTHDFISSSFNDVNNQCFFDDIDELPANIVLNIRDNFSYLGEYDFQYRKKTDGAEDIEMLCKRYPEINFVLCTSLEKLDRELGRISNLQIVPLGGDITNQFTEYPYLVEPVLTDKNFSSEKTFIALNRQARFHRIFAVSVLHDYELNNTGVITLMDQENLRCTNNELLDWQFSRHHVEVRDRFNRGFPIVRKIYLEDIAVDLEKHCEHPDYQIYKPDRPNDNVSNFNNVLRDMYKNSFVEIVSETTYAEPSFLITEKTLNSIYACNIPIFIGGVGIVEHLRNIGFDMFDDIVDHSYDNIGDPILRIHHAIKDNLRLLSDTSYVKETWIKCQDRLAANVELAKVNFYKYYIQRADECFSKLSWN